MEVVEEIPLEEESKTRIYTKRILSVFLILLFVSSLLASFGLGDIIISVTNSDLIEDGVIEHDVTVSFSDTVYTRLVELYNENLAQEFKVCLLGDVVDGVYVITEVHEPEMYFQFFNRVVSEACPHETLIALHSHPFRHCIPSEQDMKNLEQLQKNNPETIIGIMCEEERFAFFD